MNKEQFTKSCKEIVQQEVEGKTTIQDSSNQICQLCSKNFHTLSTVIPEFQEIMNIACDLELPTEYRDRPLEDWEKLKGIVEGI